MNNPYDIEMMARAIRLAEHGRYRARPNPAVGCVLVCDGVVIGEGSTQQAGGNHAEIEALAMAGEARGATAYVSLEPCVHRGRTGPCTEALISAGISRVVVVLGLWRPSGKSDRQVSISGMPKRYRLLENQIQATTSTVTSS